MKLTGCLLIVTAGGSVDGRLQESAQQPSQLTSNASNNREGAMNRRESNIASALYFLGKRRTEARICVRP
jgi:hypothetical protein